jgi:hypothetical protein
MKRTTYQPRTPTQRQLRAAYDAQRPLDAPTPDPTRKPRRARIMDDGTPIELGEKE